jgi:hypothetical protein
MGLAAAVELAAMEISRWRFGGFGEGKDTEENRD